MQRRVVVSGKNRIAVECTRVVLEAGDDVVLAVVDPADDGCDGWQPSLRRAAETAGIPTFDPADINAPSAVARVRAGEPELTLSFQYAQILKSSVIGAASLATLNLHFGPLPRYRGVAPIAWALINGEHATGVTLHHVDAGVDSGDIVSLRDVPITRNDTGRTLYDKCTDAGVGLFTEWYPRLRVGDIPRIAQVRAQALYYNRHSIDFRQCGIVWTTDAERLANWMRAFIFPPHQYPTFRFQQAVFEVVAVEWDREPHRGKPGEVLAISDGGMIVGVPGGRLILQDLRDGSLPIRPSGLTLLGFRPGVRLE